MLVEQNAYLTLQHADRAYVLESGEIALSGTAAELTADPRVQANLPRRLEVAFFQTRVEFDVGEVFGFHDGRAVVGVRRTGMCVACENAMVRRFTPSAGAA